MQPDLSGILGSSLNPLWQHVFDDLATADPSGLELLSKMAVVNIDKIPLFLFEGSAGDKAASKNLLDGYFITQHANYVRASKIMMIAHRCWLLNHGGLKKPYTMALATIANRYPDATNRSETQICWDLEPHAEAVATPAARSWVSGDDTARWNAAMLAQKRDKLYRVSPMSSRDANR